LVAAAFSYGVARKSAVIALAQKRLGDSQLEQLQAQLEVAQISAAAAKKSADVAADALYLTEGADIVIDGITADIVGGELVAQARVVVRFKNRGRTRASDVVFSGSFGVPGGREVFPPNAPVPTIIAANDEAPFAFVGNVADVAPPDVLAQINRGHVELRIDGRLMYVDVFKRPHTVTFAGHWMHHRGAFGIDKYECS
jgi:hypothetical protein